MSDQYVGEIRVFGFNFAPVGWAACNGQLLPISQNTALFSILGTQFGGDGKSTFGLPNLQGAVPLCFGSGPGLTPYNVGDSGGVASVSLSLAQMPAHTHSVGCQTGGGAGGPTNAVWGGGGRGKPPAYSTTNSPTAKMNAEALNTTGGGLEHNNLSPYVVLNFCIALVGIYPSRG